jgi:cytochrome c oxidase subunit 4
VALAIAMAKASLVVLFFMHLKYDNPVNALTFTIGSIFVVVFVAITLLDTAFRGDLGNVNAKTVKQLQAEQERQGEEAIPADSLRIAPADYPGQSRGANLGSDGGS